MFRRKEFGLLITQDQQDIAEEPQMRVLVAVDVADLLYGPRHAPKVVEKHEARIKVNTLEDVVGDQHAQEIPARTVLLELIVEIADEGIAREQMLVILPLENNGPALIGAGDGIEHIAVALRMDAFLEGLDGETEIDFIRRDISRDIRQVGTLD